MKIKAWDVGVTSVEGPNKKINEDHGFAKTYHRSGNTPYTLAVVADGMGGYRAGDDASRLVVQVLDTWAQEEAPALLELNKPYEHISRSLDQTLQQLNEILLDWSAEGLKAGSTASVLFLHQDQFIVRHIGDSRIYRLSNDGFGPSDEIDRGDTTVPLSKKKPKVQQMTEDHSWVAKQMKEGRLSKEEARLHPKRNVLLACLGIEYGCQTYYRQGDIQDHQIFLLCSDGFYTQFPDSEIEELMRFSQVYEDLQEASRRLIRQAEERNTNDNATVVLLRPARPVKNKPFWKQWFSKTKE
ncbi:serine/threonine-protein phosphatase [Bacillaceae bacterium SIJ1]|uniref:PP2C family protein-serine/threonine phosphatase n=1 Tax=Litoribacterium kuwaitense TaxID=1398745 RepID=UPI0013EB739E|nr:PP2C family serine/threonine-protein phosphatase [Litoribacterium kuwaitense]NGP44446.1 serine/threonine-protein phosphatase [Litoribacterium kuwaitense]